MRLEPIENPPNLFARIAYFMCKRQLGKVITPLKVVNARMPKSFRLAYEMVKLSERGLSLDTEIAFLVKTYVAQMNDCAFCVDIAKAAAVGKGITLEKCQSLDRHATHPVFSDRERAALAYVEEATRNKKVKDDTFDELRKRFSEREIVEITFLNAMENYYNLLNLPLEIHSDNLCSIALGRTGQATCAEAAAA